MATLSDVTARGRRIEWQNPLLTNVVKWRWDVINANQIQKQTQANADRSQARFNSMRDQIEHNYIPTTNQDAYVKELNDYNTKLVEYGWRKKIPNNWVFDVNYWKWLLWAEYVETPNYKANEQAKANIKKAEENYNKLMAEAQAEAKRRTDAARMNNLLYKWDNIPNNFIEDEAILSAYKKKYWETKGYKMPNNFTLPWITDGLWRTTNTNVSIGDGKIIISSRNWTAEIDATPENLNRMQREYDVFRINRDNGWFELKDWVIKTKKQWKKWTEYLNPIFANL